MLLFLNGKFVHFEDAKISVFDHGFLYGDGIYETMRTYDGLIFNFEAHYKRLKKSADLLKLQMPYSEKEIFDIIKELISKNALLAARVRITLSRGSNDFSFNNCKEATFCITATSLEEEPEEVYQKGVKVITVPFCRSIPEIKSVSLLPMVRAQQEAFAKHAYEALFLDEGGHVTEGSITNVYFVRQDEIHIPELDMLSGTVREVILGLAAKAGYALVFERCYKEAFYEAEEIFLTNAIRGIIPVSHIDDFPVNIVVPGEVTMHLMDLWKKNIANLLS